MPKADGRHIAMLDIGPFQSVVVALKTSRTWPFHGRWPGWPGKGLGGEVPSFVMAKNEDANLSHNFPKSCHETTFMHISFEPYIAP